MNKTFSTIMLGLFAILLISSCKKDWTCSCSYTITYKVSGFDTTINANASNTLMNTKKKDAESSCDDADAQWKQQMQMAITYINFTMGSNSASGSGSCELKEK
jgi:hypothetical protein